MADVNRNLVDILKTINTKEGRNNFWYYYKVPFWLFLFMLVMLTFTIVQCATMVRPDAVVDYIGSELYWDSEMIAEFEEELSIYIDDVNGDGQNAVAFQPLSFDIENPDPNMVQKVFIELAEGDARLLILDKAVFDNYAQHDLFEDLSPKLSLNEPTYYVSMENCRFVTEHGISDLFDDVVVCIKAIRPGKEQKLAAAQSNAYKILNYLCNR